MTETFRIIERFALSVPASEYGTLQITDADGNELSDGDYIYEGDVLTVTAEPKEYYGLDCIKVNDQIIENGSSVTVEKDISVEAAYIRLLSKDGKVLPDVTVKLSYTSAKYTGSALKPSVTVTVGNKKLQSSDYVVSYSNNKETGTATVTIKGQGFYKGTLTTKFTIKENTQVNETEISQGEKISVSSKKLSVKWGKVKRADGYDVFLAKCHTSYSKKPTVTTKKTSISVSKVQSKKIDTSKSYKVIVKAYRMVDGKKQYIASTKSMHIAGAKSKYTNASKITGVPTAKVLKVGKNSTIKAKITKVNKNKPLFGKVHVAPLRYRTSDSSVATVTSSGKIKAKGKGTCKISVIAGNGIIKYIKVTVK